MAKYTVETRTIVESGYPLFDFYYPIWNEEYREVLEQKIINRYYFREIGFETVGMFKHFLKERLTSIMPTYNELYQAKVEYLKQNAYTNKDIKTTRLQITDSESETNQSNESTSDSQTNTKDIINETPMSNLGEDDSYATEIQKAEGSQSDESSQTVTGEVVAKTVDDVLEHVIGFDGMKYAFEVYQGVRENIINIDEMILKDLNNLFMGVY